MSRPDPAREDLAASLAARRELGEEYEPALVESFLNRIEERVEQRVRERSVAQVSEKASDRSGRDNQFWIGIASLGFGIPISGVAGATGGLAGLAFAWGGIAAINVAQALSQRRRQR